MKLWCTHTAVPQIIQSLKENENNATICNTTNRLWGPYAKQSRPEDLTYGLTLKTKAKLMKNIRFVVARDRGQGSGNGGR